MDIFRDILNFYSEGGGICYPKLLDCETGDSFLSRSTLLRHGVVGSVLMERDFWVEGRGGGGGGEGGGGLGGGGVYVVTGDLICRKR